MDGPDSACKARRRELEGSLTPNMILWPEAIHFLPRGATDVSRTQNRDPIGCHRYVLLCLTKELAKIDVALSTGLLRALWLGRMVGHRLDAQATWTREAVEDKRRTGHHAANRAEDTTAALRIGYGRHIHSHPRIFPQPRAWLYIQGFARREHLLKNIAIAMQYYHTFAALTGKLIDKKGPCD